MNTHRPRKRFGQHFLVDPGVIHAIVDAIRPAADETIIEIGPGPGAITEPLARRAGALHLVELDRDLAAALRQAFADNDAVKLHEVDALKFDIGSVGARVRVVGNLPYNISTPLLFHLLQQRERVVDMHFMLQKEVVDRMAAPPGSKTYGRLSVMLGCHLLVEPLFDVEPECFDPPPEVMSAVVRLIPRPDAPHIADEAHLSRLVAAAFAQRRKTIRNALSDFASAGELEAVNIDPGVRAERIPVDAYIELSNKLSQNQPGIA
ncbi:MAG: 16S rRNA (adenine(1518)-N(6)/adenine(1519)-N(6))-dimethyltransferase RsmA [Pseudomonadota bacterium]